VSKKAFIPKYDETEYLALFTQGQGGLVEMVAHCTCTSTIANVRPHDTQGFSNGLMLGSN
jgi:hypothetical protein